LLGGIDGRTSEARMVCKGHLGYKRERSMLEETFQEARSFKLYTVMALVELLRLL